MSKYVAPPTVTIDGTKYVFYRLFIDETGALDARKHPEEHDRFLSLTGAILSVAYLRNVVQGDIDNLRAAHFGHTADNPVVLHRTDIRACCGPFQCLRDPDRRKAWGDAFLAFLEELDTTVITVTVDKVALAKKHPHQDPYHLGVITLCERYFYFLNGKNAVGDVIAECRTPGQDDRLRAAFKEFRSWKSWYINNKDIQKRVTCKKLKVLPKKKDVVGLQIADLLAAPSFFTALHLYLKRDFPSNYSRRVGRVLYTKYYKRPIISRLWAGREGYGIIWRPK